MRFVAVLLLLSSAAQAMMITDHNKTFAMVCVTDKGIGFDWKDGDWQLSNYRSYTYIFRRLELSQCGNPSLRQGILRLGCYAFALTGENLEPQICSEYWDTTGTLDHIFCNSLNGPRIDASAQLQRFAVTATSSVFSLSDRRRDFGLYLYREVF